jgi:uncharacterized protein with von Willebrand factor type A (vWA) domain
MTRVTRFATRDGGPLARVAGFMAHLRDNGLRLGVGEAETALAALAQVQAHDPVQARLALRAVCTGCADDAARFDALFDAYWMNGGRVVHRAARQGHSRGAPRPAGARATATADGPQAPGHGDLHAPDGTGTAEADGAGRLVAARSANLLKKDLREIVTPADIAEAEAVAERLGRALRDRRSRRRRAARRGAQLDLRRILRHSLSAGGEPLRLFRRTRPDRPLRIVALCDVSGSMVAYARPFLAFLVGLMRHDPAADAYLFHTRLVRLTEAMRDPDPLRTLNRLTLLSEGFGGGSRIGGALGDFARRHAPAFVDGRSVVIVMSDGYDSDDAAGIGTALARIRRRGCRILWLNPLAGWKDYEPVARGMAAALPHIDALLAANTLDRIADLAEELART